LAVGVNQSDNSQVSNLNVTNAQSMASSPLVHELQLGERLNECIHETRRADFSLMLAMLAEDVREHSQFSLPESDSLVEGVASNEQLRKQFSLPKQAPLALKTLEDIPTFNQAEAILANDLASIRLANAIAPKPLAFRDDKQHIASDVINNTSMHCQLRFEKLIEQKQNTFARNTLGNNIDNNDDLINQTLPLNVAGWLSGIEQSLVKSSLVN
jgi:hypothetical protein